MTQSQRNRHIADWKRTLLAIEKRYAPSVRKALKGQLDQIAHAVRVGGVEFAQRRLSSLEFNKPMADALNKMHRSVGVMMAKRTYNSLEKSPVGQKYTLGQAAQWLADIIEFFANYLLDSITSINQTTRNWIRDRLNEGFENGWSNDDIVRAINNQTYMGYRTELIVRTESVRAANYGVQKGAESYEYETKKEWVAIRDDRTRHTHLLVDRQQVNLNEDFSNGLEFPGDPKAGPGEVCNCRCTMVINPQRDDNGRLKPKRQQTLITA